MSIALTNRVSVLERQLESVKELQEQQAQLVRLLVDKRDPKLKAALEAMEPEED